jgi:hypothetical protein
MDPIQSIHTAITTGIKFKQLYDAFCDKHGSSAARVQELASRVEIIQDYLGQLQEIFKNHKAAYPRVDRVERILNECNEFLEHYQPLLEEKKKGFNWGRAFKTTEFMTEDTRVVDLKDKLSSCSNDMGMFVTCHFAQVPLLWTHYWLLIV